MVGGRRVQWSRRLLMLLLALSMSAAMVSAEPLEARQISINPPGGGGGQVTNPPAEDTTAQTTPEVTPNPPAVSETTTNTQPTPAQPDTTNQPQPSANQPAQPSQAQPNTPTTQPANQPSQDVPQSQAPSIVVVTESDTTVTQTNSQPTNAAAASQSSAAPSESAKPEEKGLGTGPIIGMSVAGGIAVLGIIGFFVWKFTRKRFNDYDDNEAIKWPELNQHTQDETAGTHALPTHNTGRAGFGDDNDSQYEVSRAPSAAGFHSSADLNHHHDPYAVPPLPHLNPSQPGPYRDDPVTSNNLYDPYSGSVPQFGAGPNEAIPMTQMRSVSPGPMRAISPNPQAAAGAGYGAYGGRASPGPSIAYGAGDPYGPR